MLCSWARLVTHAVPVSAQVYKYLGVELYDGLVSHPGGAEILPVVSCHRKRGQLQPYEPLDFTYLNMVMF